MKETPQSQWDGIIQHWINPMSKLLYQLTINYAKR